MNQIYNGYNRFKVILQSVKTETAKRSNFQ